MADRARSLRSNLAVGQKLAVGFGLVAVVLLILLVAEAPVCGSDQIGNLAEAFNSMLRQLRHREAKMTFDDSDCLDSCLHLNGRPTGGRVGVIRSTSRTHMHATTDGLTGLFNRRTFEARVRAMHQRRPAGCG
ncbi:MAG: hypothetical protein ACC652_03885 [Acidimicrobiales bacterium]